MERSKNLEKKDNSKSSCIEKRLQSTNCRSETQDSDVNYVVREFGDEYVTLCGA